MKKSRDKKRVAIIGSQGVPPKYGGFETLVDNILANAGTMVEYTVFCSKPDMDTQLSTYKGARLKYVNLHAHGAMSVPYDIISLIKAIKGYDAILILGVSGGVFLPLFRLLSRAKVIVNIDGLEHEREKWSSNAKRYLRYSFKECMRWANVIVSDNKGIQDYVRVNYHKYARLISYGGDHALRNVSPERAQALLNFHGLQPGEYDLSICRIEPENNCHLTLEAYSGSGRDLVIIGNWNHSDYSRNLYTKYKGEKGMHLLSSIYDLDVLYVLRHYARRYVHGHKAGGTNPSLVEAMFFKSPILAFDVIYNRETTQNQAYYFKDAEALRALLEVDELPLTKANEVACKEYVWASIARQYEELF